MLISSFWNHTELIKWPQNKVSNQEDSFGRINYWDISGGYKTNKIKLTLQDKPNLNLPQLDIDKMKKFQNSEISNLSKCLDQKTCSRTIEEGVL